MTGLPRPAAQRPQAARIVINGRFLTRPFSGVQRYALEMVRALDRLAGSDRIAPEIALHRPCDAPELAGLEHIRQRRVGRRRGHLWEQVELPLSARGALLVNFCNTAPALCARQIMTIHDAGPLARPRSYALPYRLWHRLLYRVAGRGARMIVTVSAFSRIELIKHCPFMGAKIAVVPNAAEHILREPAAALARPDIATGRYALLIASDNELKNLALLPPTLRLLGAAAPPLVIVGRSLPRIFGHRSSLGNVPATYLERVCDAELQALYRGALCLIFPSLYEGFGLPPLEAMQCGCPVLAAAAASLPEICGSAALYFNPCDPNSLAQALRRLLGDEAKRRSLIAAGHKQAARYNWAASAAQFMEVVDLVLERDRG